MSTIDQAQIRESPPAKDRRPNHWATPPAAREVPWSNRAVDQKFSRKSLRFAALGAGCILTVVPRSTQPSILRGTVNEYKLHGWVIIPMVMGECSAYSSLQADSKVKFAAWLTSSRPPGTDPLPKWTLAYGWRRRWQDLDIVPSTSINMNNY